MPNSTSFDGINSGCLAPPMLLLGSVTWTPVRYLKATTDLRQRSIGSCTPSHGHLVRHAERRKPRADHFLFFVFEDCQTSQTHFPKSYRRRVVHLHFLKEICSTFLEVVLHDAPGKTSCMPSNHFGTHSSGHTPACCPELLDHEQAGELLGISASTLKRLVRSGKVGPQPVKFTSRLVKWRAVELRAWVAAGCPTRKQWAERGATPA